MMYSMKISFMVRLVAILIMLILVSDLVVSSSNSRTSQRNALIKQSFANENATVIRPDLDSSYELINSTFKSTNSTDGRKSANLHLLTRLYQSLHALHNRHHHHHMHHLGRGSSFGSTLFGDRPFNRLFRDRQMERPMNYDGQMDRPAFDRPAFDGPYNRRYGRPWYKRRKRQIDDNLDNALNDYIDPFNYKKATFTQLTTLSPSFDSFYRSPFYSSSSNNFSSFYKSSPNFNRNSSSSNPFILTTFKPSVHTVSQSYDRLATQRRPYYSSNLKSPAIASTKSYLTSTTPNSVSLTTASSYYLVRGDTSPNDPLFENLSSYNSTHHYYHQAYLLYKYFKRYKDKNVNEIDWPSIPDEIRDKFKMLVLTLRYAHSKKNGLNSTLSDEVVISKALDIVKWKGWELQEQKAKRKEMSNKKFENFRPIIPTTTSTTNERNVKSTIEESTVDESSVRQSAKEPFKESSLKQYFRQPKDKIKTEQSEDKFTKEIAKQPSPFERQWTTNQINPIDQIDEIDTNTYPSDTYSSNAQNTYPSVFASSNTYSSVDTSVTTVKPLTTTMSSNDELKRAFENIEDIRLNHSCSWPRGRLMNLKELNHDYRFLLPKWVYLHKCDNQAGCCSNQRQYCAPTEQEVVSKYFYNLSSNKKQSRVIRLEFVNDTRCQCRDMEKIASIDLNTKDDKSNTFRPINQNSIKQMNKSSFLPSYSTLMSSPSAFEGNLIKMNEDQLSNNHFDRNNQRDHLDDIQLVYGNQFEPFRTNGRYTGMHSNQRFYNRPAQPYDTNRYESLNNAIQTDENRMKTLDRSNSFWNKKFNGKLNVRHLFDCNTDIVCPEPYTIIPDRNEQVLCYCGCKSKNSNCIKVMNGLMRLDNYQINCVLSGQCHQPECLFKAGDLDYNKNTGYCPSKEDLLAS